MLNLIVTVWNSFFFGYCMDWEFFSLPTDSMFKIVFFRKNKKCENKNHNQEVQTLNLFLPTTGIWCIVTCASSLQDEKASCVASM